jgi:hypothetical protein
LTEQPVVWRVRLALHLSPAGQDGPPAEGIEVIPVAALRTSASAGADGPVVALSGEADATTAAELRETLTTQPLVARLLEITGAGRLLDVRE